ncbi:MAG: hypothetical protein HeimC3_43120 [Candidatus Heimdallarchaeota archaeon LC_3]|nr:MAG: hypothetical protein HeimC3_43120 [Candidatus Heimdallarchaeota archaeon LC_3]
MLEIDLLLSLTFVLGPTLLLTTALILINKFKSQTVFWYLLERVMAGYVIFWILYILFPAFLNVINPIEDGWKSLTILKDFSDPQLTIGAWSADPVNFIKYFIQFFANTVVLYLFYPFTLFPIIFILGPVISFFILWRQLKKSGNESFTDKLKLIQFEIEASPTEMINERLVNRDWTQQKELLKILLVVLPISLYLLMTLMKVTGFQEQSNILSGTSLGWFLEIFFVYLATIMFGVHLLYSGKISFKGDYIGLRVRDAMIQSLSTVGAFISILAVVLFIIDYQKQIFVVIYFIGYFVMVTLIFILILDIFEPISIFLLIKFIETFKNYEPSTTQTGLDSEPNREKDSPKEFEIFVPDVNLDELSSEPQEELDTSESQKVEEKEEVSSELREEKVIQERINVLTLKNVFLRDFIKYFSVVALGVLIFLLTSNIVIYAINSNNGLHSIFENLLRNQYSLTLLFVVLIIIFSPSLLIPTILVSRKLVVPAILSILVHIFLIFTDFALRNFLIAVNTDVKFSEIAYQTFYFSLQYIGFIFILGLSILLLRRFKWEVIPNVGLLVTSGFMIGFVWLFMLKPAYLNDLALQLSGVSISVFPTIPGVFGAFLSNANSIPFTTFNPLIQGLIPWIYNAPGSEVWVTVIFQPILLDSGSLFLNPFLVEVPVEFSPILGISSIPFTILRDFSNVFLFGMLFFFIGKEFLTVIFQRDEKGSTLEKSVFSVSDAIPSPELISKHPNQYAVIRNFGLEPLIDDYGQPIDRELSPLESAIYNMELGEQGKLGQIILEFTGESPISFTELSETMQTNLEDIINFFEFIDKTQFARENPFTVIRREYGYEYEEAKMDSLHIMMTDGRSVFTHSFQEESTVEPALVAGLFSAITSFAKEAVKAEKLLRTIDHGDVVLIIEYGQFVYAALFVDRNSIDLRSKLAQFLQEFEAKHVEDLENWLGDTSTFVEDWQLVEQIFE